MMDTAGPMGHFVAVMSVASRTNRLIWYSAIMPQSQICMVTTRFSFLDEGSLSGDLYWPSLGLPGVTVKSSSDPQRWRGWGWGKNGANHTPNHAIQCPLCISASRQGQALPPAVTGLSYL